MSTLIFKLRHVPDNEAQAIRDLLDSNQIEWFETSAGNWGIAMPGIWAANDEQVPTARELIDRYQAEHTSRQRELHEQLRQQGLQKSLKQILIERPFRTIGIVLFCIFILYVSIHPFLQMIGYSRS